MNDLHDKMPAADGRRLTARAASWVLRVAIAVAVLWGAFLIRRKLAGRPTELREKAQEETARAVRVMEVRRRAVPLRFTGYGTARPLRVVTVSAEVRGRIIELRPDTRPGVLLPEGETLCRIEPADFELALKQAETEALTLEAETARLNRNQAEDARRVELLERACSLATREFERAGALLAQRVGSKADVERAEQALVQQQNVLAAIESSLALYPMQLKAVGSQRAGAALRIRKAQLDLDRCTVAIPFPARLQSLHIEEGEVVNVGSALAALADDRALEIPVALDSDSVVRGLQLSATTAEGQRWLVPDSGMEATVSWVGSTRDTAAAGEVVRVETLDPDTRTLTLVVRLRGPAGAAEGEPPLVAGMFCRVAIDGKLLADALVIPRSAIQLGGKVLVIEEGRMVERDVVLSHTVDNRAVVASGLQDGALIVVDRVPGPVDGMRVRVTERVPAPEDEAAAAPTAP